jgi:hypothetical protein
MKLTTDFHLMPRLRMSGAVLLLPICLHAADRDNFTFAFDFLLFK